MKKESSGYKYTKQIFDFAENHPEQIKPGHIALYLWCVELNNRLHWIEKFKLPRDEASKKIGIKHKNTYQSILNDLAEWGLITVIVKAKNQYAANVISLVQNKSAGLKNVPANESAGTKNIPTNESAGLKNVPVLKRNIKTKEYLNDFARRKEERIQLLINTEKNGNNCKNQI